MLSNRISQLWFDRLENMSEERFSSTETVPVPSQAMELHSCEESLVTEEPPVSAYETIDMGIEVSAE